MEYKSDIEQDNFDRAGQASSDVKKMLKQLGIDASIIKRVAVALMEAEINVVAHADYGHVSALIDNDKIVIIVEDVGPGIPNIDIAMQEGYSTASQKVRERGWGAGMGLPNIKKNVDDLKIYSEVGKGTKIKMTVYF
jgi:anti-sigma regulatory factor (Ser/Thr protein kinase)